VTWTRRDFLIASAGLVAGACAGGAKNPAPAKNAAPDLPVAGAAFAQFDHLVVLMLENRTFDNMLGYLYQPGQVPRRQQFDGVAGKNLWNPGPNGSVPVSAGTVMDNPNPDPGEEYPHLNTDFFGTVIPPTNQYVDVKQMTVPFNAPSPIPYPAPMNGFVQDYVNNFTNTQKRAPTAAEYSIIMNCFAPESVPVISALAEGFGVADHWHCEVPSQTFCNRSFFHAATSSGFTSNEPYAQFPLQNNAPTVFNRLGDRGVSWRIYYDLEDLVPLTWVIHWPALGNAAAPNVHNMTGFFDDVKNGNLPAYSFIEPRLIFNHNDEHPPATLIGNIVLPSSVLAGEKLIADVYNAIRTSNSPTGSNWRNTALLITYDEGGGCYDHVQPPPAPPPQSSAPPGEEGFRFDRLGQRVPAVLVSAYTQAGTVVNSPMRHTAVVRSMSQKWGLTPLTDRDRTAPTLAPFFNLRTPRPVADWPTVEPRALGTTQEDPSRPLNELQLAFIGALDAVVPPSGAAANVKTLGDARTFLQQKSPNAPR
jgi:phospholipase C